jgi:amino acid transporter
VWFWAFDQMVNPVVKEIVYIVVFVAQLLCGLATVTSASRMIFAFSRDGGLPASGALSKVSPKYRTPVAAIWTGATLAVLFVWGSSVISVAGTSAYTIVVSCTVIFLFLSFTFPIVLGALAWGTPKWDKMGPWNLGRGVFMLFAVLSVLSMILIIVLGIQPPNDKALYIVIGFFVLTAIVWFGFEQRRFKGPPMGEIIAARQAAIAEAEKAVGER